MISRVETPRESRHDRNGRSVSSRSARRPGARLVTALAPRGQLDLGGVARGHSIPSVQVLLHWSASRLVGDPSNRDLDVDHRRRRSRRRDTESWVGRLSSQIQPDAGKPGRVMAGSHFGCAGAARTRWWDGHDNLVHPSASIAATVGRAHRPSRSVETPVLKYLGRRLVSAVFVLWGALTAISSSCDSARVIRRTALLGPDATSPRFSPRPAGSVSTARSPTSTGSS